MRVGMGMLAAACVALGLGATWFLPVFDPITQQAMRRTRQLGDLIAGNGFVLLGRNAARRHRLDRWASPLMLVLLSALAGALLAALGPRQPPRRRAHLGLRPARAHRRQRVHRHRIFQAASA